MTERAVDSHAHVHGDRLGADMVGVLERARAAGVEAIVDVGTDPEDNRRAAEFAAREPMLYAAVGFHPHTASAIKAVDWPVLEELAARREVVALGEFGLDYHYEHSPRGVQREVFRAGARLAAWLDVPLVIHSREAEADTLRVLDSAADGAMPRGVFHCFTGSAAFAREALARGFYVSFSGIVTFPSAEAVREAALVVPFDRLLVETDAPYCAPVPKRGRTNEPAYVAHVIAFLAELYGLEPEDVCRITRRNAVALFGLPLEVAGGCLVYPIGRGLYVNVTGRCSNRCTFCRRTRGEPLVVKGHDLALARDPSAEELVAALEAAGPEAYDEVVLCGYGEPTLRLDIVKAVARAVKKRWRKPVRLNTNGQGSALAGRDIVPELAGLVDEASVSLDAQDAETYERLCRPTVPGAFEAVCGFIRGAAAALPRVTATAVAVPGLDVEAVRRLAEDELGVAFRARPYRGLA